MIGHNRPNSPRDSARNERLDVLSGTRGQSGAKAVRHDEFALQLAQAWQSVAGQRIYHRSAVLGADVTLTAGGTWYDGPFIGLDPGIYMVFASAQITNDAAAAAQDIAARIFDGEGPLAAGQGLIGASSGNALSLTIFAPVVITKAKTITLQARSASGNANTRIKAAVAAAGADLVATRITALRIGDE